MARKNNTLILPSNVADVTGVVGSAVSVYKSLAKTLHVNAEQDIIGDSDDKKETQSPRPEIRENQVSQDYDKK